MRRFYKSSYRITGGKGQGARHYGKIVLINDFEVDKGDKTDYLGSGVQRQKNGA